MYDVEQLRKTLLHDDFVASEQIRILCKEAGYPVSISCAVAYRAGVTEGKRDQKGNLKRVYKQLEDAKEHIRIQDAAYERLLELQELLAHPLPDRDITEIIAEIDAAYAAHQQEQQQETQQDDGPAIPCNIADLIAEGDH